VSPLVVVPGGEHRFSVPSVLPDQPAEIAEAVASRKQPEHPLAEEKIAAVVASPGVASGARSGSNGARRSFSRWVMSESARRIAVADFDLTGVLQW
jgi:hypothetical protein